MIKDTAAVAAKLRITPRRVTQLVGELGLTPKRVGNTYIFTQREFNKLNRRNTKPGPSDGRKR